MHTLQELAVRLAKAYALTEILPLRHSRVQEALDSFSGSLTEGDFGLELRYGALWTMGGRVEAGDEVDDLAKGLGRCGVTAVGIAAGMESRAIGTFLDTLRIASISGHLTNLHEMVAFHADRLKVRFDGLAESPSEWTQPAGAIFAGALAVTESDSVAETVPPAGVLEAPTPHRESAPPKPREWDPPGAVEPKVQGETESPDPGFPQVEPTPREWTFPEATVGEVPAEEPLAPDASAVESPSEEGHAPDGPGEGALSLQEFGKGVGLFMGGSPAQRRGWVGSLSRQAARVDVESDLAGTLDIAITLLGNVDEEGDESVTDVAKHLVRPAVARELALRLVRATDEDERGILLQVAGQIGAVVAPAFAEELATSEDRAARRSLVHALTSLGEASLGVVEGLIDREEWYVVRNAVTVLSAIGGSATVDWLKPCLSHVDARVRRETVMALAKLGGDRAGQLLMGALVDRDPDVRAAATMVAGSLGVWAAAPVLRDRLTSEENEGVVIEALRALGKLGDVDSVQLLKKRAVPSFFSRPSKAVRIAAYRALGAIRTPEAVRLVEEATEDRDPEIRAAAQQAVESLT